jgi:predicted RecB family nuclease
LQIINEKLILSASDLTNFLACEHLTQLTLASVRGELACPELVSPDLEVIARRGQEHEQRYLEHLRSEGLSIIEITRSFGPEGQTVATRDTIEAMATGVDIIYQGTFTDGRWLGHADFLRRVPVPSNFGAYSYEVEDTKLSRKVKASALLQVCAYSHLLEPIQGHSSDEVHLILGDMSRHSFLHRDYAAYFRSVKSQCEDAVFGMAKVTYPTPVEHCAICRWSGVCEARRREDDHLSLVAGICRGQIKKLAGTNIHTVADLAAAPANFRVQGIGQPTLDRLRHQARMQVEKRETGKMSYELIQPVIMGRGLGALPPPTADDLFFDMEGDPFAEDGGLEYLFGVVELVDGEPLYHSFWGHNQSEEKQAFEAFIDFIMTRLEKNSNLHIYHYASYETAAVKRLMGIHATREEEVDRLLRGGIFVDLYRVVQQGVCLSVESYSIKKIEPLYMMERAGEIIDAASSIVAYEEWLESGDGQILEDIAKYNYEDCFSMVKLQTWLEAVREEARVKSGQELPRPETRDPEPSEALAEAEEEIRQLVDGLTASVPVNPDERTNEQQALWLLTQLLGWHRREAKAGWWAFFNRLELTDAELEEDSEAIGGLTYLGETEIIKQSVVHRYKFDPEQDHKIKKGDIPVDPATEKPAGTVHHIDSMKGIIDLKRGGQSTAPHPTSVIPGPPINTKVLREALNRVAIWVVEHGIDSPGPYRSVRDLLLSLPPRISGLSPGENLVNKGELVLDVARRLAVLLNETCLPIQGPPGAGKTYTGARMIVDLVREGKRVGITATSHKAIGNLLKEVCQYAAHEGVTVRAIQKAPEGDQVEAVNVVQAKNNQEVESALNLRGVDVIAGTAWLFARGGLIGQLDVLFVDEAAQMSLANVIGVGGAANNIVLLGDPCQLAQPSQGSHPPGSELSALEHLLGEHITIPPDRGLFLDITFRLHPDVCQFVSEIFYEGRLEADKSCTMQAIADGSALGGTGLRYLSSEHEGNRTSSTEEAKLIKREVEALLGREWTDHTGNKRPLTYEDILVVAPYNAQVARIAHYLPRGARVGTVDKFQGQEAPISIYSMATSSTEEIPRGADFLYSANRLNVAVSRACGLAVLVCCPGLLRVRCRTPKEMRLVNAFCRLVELAN